VNDTKIVYVLTNPAMPGLVKIGYTSQNDEQTRVDQLYTTGVPVPFEIKFAAKVDRAEDVEKALHTAFAPHRINPKREFFKIDPEQAIVLLRLFQKEDVTKEIQQTQVIDAESIAAGEQLRKKRSPMDFTKMQIPIGSKLYFTEDDTSVTVTQPRKVLFNNEELSLTAVTKKLLSVAYDVQPSLHWTYDGRLLKKIYDEMYESLE
jgi:hypothetical protein